MTIDELNALTTLTAADEVPVWDKEASGEPTKKITASNLAASVKSLASLPNTMEMNDAIAQSTASLMVQTAQFSIAPNSYTDIDYPTGYAQENTRVLSAIIANYYVDFTHITIQLTSNKIRVFNSTEQDWAGVQLILTKF